MTQIPQLPPHIDVQDDDLLVVRQSDNKDHKVPVAALSKGNVRYVQTIDDLRAVNGMQDGQATEIVSTGRAGLFRWQSGDLSSECAADPMMGIYVPPVGQDGSAGAWVRAVSGPVSVLWFGADGGNSPSMPITSAINGATGFIRRRGFGGEVYIPAGVHYLDGSVDYYVGGVRGISFIGDGSNSTSLVWVGGAGVAFTNERPAPPSGGPYNFQYGISFKGITISTVVPGAGISQPVPDSVGVHIEMAQKHWAMDDVSIVGFDTNLFVGVHAEAGHIQASQFAYGRINVNVYGNQADCTTFLNVWNYGAKERGYIVSSPRTFILGGFIGSARGYSLEDEYVGVQVGYQSTRTQDVGKSTFLTSTSTGAGGGRCTVNNVSFEGDGSRPHILVDNIDLDTRRFSDLNFLNNFFALYGRSAAIEFTKSYDAITTRNNRLSRSFGSSSALLDVQTASCGQFDCHEPHVVSVFKTDLQRWMHAAHRDDFIGLPQVASNPLNPGGVAWKISNPSSAQGLFVDVDFDGLLNTEVSYSNPAANAIVRIERTSCPADRIYFSVPAWIDDGSEGVSLTMTAATGSGVVLAAVTGIALSQEARFATFAFDNPSVQTVRIQIGISVAGSSGKFYLGEPLIKHGDGSPQALQCLDTRSGLRFTRNAGSVHDYTGRIPYVKIADFGDLTSPEKFVGPIKRTSAVGNHAQGVTQVEVADAQAVSVGDFLWFKPVEAAGLSGAHRGGASGNKITSISGSVVTLNAGIPFAISDGGSIVAASVYTASSNSKD